MSVFAASRSVRSPGPLLAASPARRRWALGVGTWLVWLLVGLSVGGWLLHGLSRTPTVDLPAQTASLPTIDAQHVLAAVRGSAQAPVESSEASGGQWQLLGVVTTPDGRGAALLSRNGERARPVRVGQPVPDSDWVLQAIEGRSVRLGPSLDAATALRLTLPTAGL